MKDVSFQIIELIVNSVQIIYPLKEYYLIKLLENIETSACNC